MDNTLLIEEINQKNDYLSTRFGIMNKETLDVLTELKDVIAKAESINYYEGQFIALSILSAHYIDKNDAINAFEIISRAKKLIDDELVDQRHYANIYNKYLIYYGSLEENYEKANEYFRLGIANAERYGDLKNKMFLKNNFAVNNLRIGHYAIAVELLEDVLYYYEANKRAHSLLFVYDNLGNAYNGLGQWDLSEKYYEKARQIAFSIEDAAMIKDTSIGLAKLQFKNNHSERATEILLEAIDYTKTCNNLRNELELEIELCRIKFETGSTYELINRLKWIKEKIEAIDLDSIKASFYELSYKIYEKVGLFEEALINHSKFCLLEKRRFEKKGEEINYEILQEEYQKNIKRLKAIAEIGRDITTLLTLKDVLNEILKRLKEVLEINIIGIGKIIDDQLVYDYFMIDHLIVKPFTRPIEGTHNLSTWVIKNRKEIFINNLDDEFESYSQTLDIISVNNEKKAPSSVMYSPLIYKEDVVGVFTIQSYKKYAYSSEEYEIFRIISSYITVALINSIQSQSLLEKSVKDDLTGLYNRRGFVDFSNTLFSTANYEVHSCALIMFDLDSFKNINDVYGHDAGDQVLRNIGTIINDLPKEALNASRIGGEEFAFMVLNESIETVQLLSETLRHSIETTEITYEHKSLKVTTSIGIAYTTTKDFMRFTLLYKESDSMLYKAKAEGKNCIKVSILVNN